MIVDTTSVLYNFKYFLTEERTNSLTDPQQIEP